MADALTQQRLLRAIDSGNSDQVRELLAAGADVNHPTQDPDGETPLIRAITAGDFGVVQLLIRAGADVNLAQRGSKSWTPLIFACEKPAIVRELLAAGADVHACTPVQTLNCSAGVKHTGFGGETALHFAAAMNNVEVVKLLVQAGAEVEARTERGLAPLDLALRLGSVTDAAEALVEAGAALTAQRLDAMHAAAHSVDSDLLHFPWGMGPSASTAPAGTRSKDSKMRGEATPSAGWAGYAEFKCPKCQSLIYSRKSKTCGTCGTALPPELLSTDQQAQVLEAKRKWARELAEKFGSEASPHGPSASDRASNSAREKGEMLTFSPGELLNRTDRAGEFRHRRRPHFIFYVIGYAFLLFTIVCIDEAAGGIRTAVWLPITGLICVLCYRAWQCATPICPNCKQNIRTCQAVFCLACGKQLRSSRCERCAVDHCWTGLLFPSSSTVNFRWIAYCPSCGVWLDSKVRRWGAWGRI